MLWPYISTVRPFFALHRPGLTCHSLLTAITPATAITFLTLKYVFEIEKKRRFGLFGGSGVCLLAPGDWFSGI